MGKAVWTIESEAKLMQLANTYLSQGLKTIEAFKKVSEELGMSNATTCRAKYYVILHGGGKAQQHKDKKFNKYSAEDKKRLIKIVTETIENGGKVKDGLKKASKELGYPYMSCKSQWEHAKNVNRSRERVEWTPEEDKILIGTIINGNEEGIVIEKACEIAAKELNRTKTSCLGRWSNKFREDYIDKVQLAFEHWTKEEKDKLLNIVSRETKKGNTLIKSFEIAGEELDRTIDACQAAYNSLREQRLDYDIHVGTWLEKEEQMMKEMIFTGVEENKEIGDIFTEVSEKLGKTLKAVTNRWYYYILPNCKEEYAKIRTAKTGRLKFTEKERRNDWTSFEDEILLEIVNRSIDKKGTIKAGLKEASKILGNRTENACNLRYYTIYKKTA